MKFCEEDVRNYLCRFNEILDQMKLEMLATCTTNNITTDFIRCMIPHHQAAIYMCENLLKYTRCEALQRIARNIIRTQTKGIEQMKEIARTTRGFGNCSNDVMNYNREYRRIVQEMVCRMENSKRSNNIDLNFTSEMIPHHEGAIEMCHNLLKYCIDPRLKCVAEDIIKEQSRGVRQLKEIENAILMNGKNSCC